MLNKDIFPTRDLKLAAICAAAAIPPLVVVGYPAEDLAAAVVTLYLLFYVVTTVVMRIVLFLLRRLVRYSMRVSRKLMAGREVEPLPSGRPALAKAMAEALFILLHGAIVGVTLVAGNLAVVVIGLNPLPTFSQWIGWVCLGVGGTFFVGTLGLATLAIFAVDSLSETVNPKFDQFQAVTREVDDRLRLRHLKGHVTLPT